MPKGFYNVPHARNEQILSYAPGSRERKELKNVIDELRSKEIDLPMIIGGREVYTDRKVRMFPPHEIKHTLGHYNQGDASHVEMAIDAALEAREKWANYRGSTGPLYFLKPLISLQGPIAPKSMQLPCWGSRKIFTRQKLMQPANLPIFTALV
jgi:1-pyrroline-5-carboxylate dehydrogenase